MKFTMASVEILFGSVYLYTEVTWKKIKFPNFELEKGLKYFKILL